MDCSKLEGMKYDEGKLDYTLLPWGALEEVVKVLEFGKKKYARDNWQKVPEGKIRYVQAGFRHLIAYTTGEENDKESGLSHLAHAICCLMFVLSLNKEGGDNQCGS